jgi:hypothetical protein
MVMSTVAIFAIVINALFLQKGPHPAPIFAARPLLQREAILPPRLSGTSSHIGSDLAAQARVQLIANIQRELSRKGFTMGRRMLGARKRTLRSLILQASARKSIRKQTRTCSARYQGYVRKPVAAAAAPSPPTTDPSRN